MRSQKTQRLTLSRAMRKQGKTWVQIAEAFRVRYKVNARVAYRYAHCLNQGQVARMWCDRWPDDPTTHKNISYWEVWPAESGRVPSLATLTRLAELYQCCVSDLLADLPNYRPDDEANTDRCQATLSPVPGAASDAQLGFSVNRGGGNDVPGMEADPARLDVGVPVPAAQGVGVPAVRVGGTVVAEGDTVAGAVFGARLKKLRVGRGLSLRRLGRLVHYSHGYLWDLETGAKRPTAEVASALDRALGSAGALSKLVADAVATATTNPVATNADAVATNADAVVAEGAAGGWLGRRWLRRWRCE